MNRPPALFARLTAPTMRQVGYTLIEVMVVVAIVGILTAAAVPSFNQMMQRQRVEAQVSSLISALRSARSEAVKRGQMVAICPTSNPNDDLPTCAAGSPDWSQGWVIFVDNGPAPRTLEAGETIINVQQRFDGSGGVTNNALNSIVFLPTGLPVGGVQSSFVVLPYGSGASSSPLVRNIVLSAPGRVRVDKPNIP